MVLVEAMGDMAAHRTGVVFSGSSGCNPIEPKRKNNKIGDIAYMTK